MARRHECGAAFLGFEAKRWDETWKPGGEEIAPSVSMPEGK